MNIHGVCEIIVQFLPKVPNMPFEQKGVIYTFVAPDPVGQSLVRKYLSLVQHEFVQQLELDRGQVYLLVAPPNDAPLRLDHDVARAYRLPAHQHSPVAVIDAPQDRLDPCEKLL